MAGRENMVAAFADYASQFLNRQQLRPPSSPSSSQPIFFSFTSDGGSRAGNAHSVDLDDLDDPHLRASEHMSRQTVREADMDDEDDDPYLRLDEEEAGVSRHHQPRTRAGFLAVSEASESKGWLAHASPLRSPSPPSSLSSVESRRQPPPRLLSPPLTPPPPRMHPPLSQPLPPPPTQIALSLTESLLPRDGQTRPVDVFSLPDPRYVPRGRRKYNDSMWTMVWCSCLTICYFCCLLILFLKPPKRKLAPLPYTTLLHTVPMLTILIILSAMVSYAHIFLLRIFVKPVMVATTVFIPATLLISAVWAFVGSFMWDEGQEPTWGETVGLRLFSLVPLVLAIITGRRLLNLPRELHTASSLLNLTTRILVANPFLLGLSPAVLLAALLASIPFLTLAFRLLLIGYFSHPFGDKSSWEWHVHAWANWAIAGTVLVWLWTWGVARGLLRVTCAGVIAAWYFADPAFPPPPPSSTHTIHAALYRATQPSLGSICLSALILAGVRFLGLVCIGLRTLPAYLPPYLRPVSLAAGLAVGYLENATSTLSTYALAYVGLTGDPFFPSAHRSRALTSQAESGLARYQRKFKTEPPLTMLTVAPLTLTFPFALTTYLFVAHTLDAPNEALGASLLAGAVTALVGLFSVGLVKDTADTLYICYCIDKDTGARHREEVFAAFEYESTRRTAPQRNHVPPPRTAPAQPPPPSSARTPQPPHAKPPMPQSRYSFDEPPRRTSRLEPPAREETPDPFDVDHAPEDPFLPASTPDVGASLARSRILSPEPHSPEPPLAMLEEQAKSKHVEVEVEESEESQLFPGSDLF